MRTIHTKVVLCMVAVFLACGLWSVRDAFAGSAGDKKKQELLDQIRKLEEQRATLQSQSQQKISEKKEKGKSLEEIVARYETLMAGCTKKSERCADVLFTLAQLYYDQGRDNYIKAREQYGRDMDAWEKTQKGPEPVNPLPNYSKSMKMYGRLTKEYSDFKTIDEAYYQMGSIYLVMGEVDSSELAFEAVIKASTNGARASAAHFRIADFAYLKHDYPRALKHLEQCKSEGLSPDNLGMVQYRKGEINYNMGEFDKAVDLFYQYIQK
jgi:tetratricopeptide (TPR) repeat protein